MQNTPSDKERFSILYLSRGRGRGHAMPDMAVGDQLLTLSDNVDIKYASYSSGADTFRANGYDVIDLNMSDDPDPWEALIKEIQLVGALRPNLVVAHEECQAVIAAEAFRVPSIFITDFFMDPTNHWMQALKPAMEILFIGSPGRFTEPPYLNGRVQYVGPAIRRLDYSDAERHSSREELQVSDDTTVILCQPGNYSESVVPIYDVLLKAWDMLPYAAKRLVWLAGNDYENLASRCSERPDITILRVDWRIDRLFAACDLVITKANRTTVFEAASLGIPSISLSTGANWPDEVAISGIRSNVMLNARFITPENLAKHISEGVRSGRRPTNSLPQWSGIEAAAERISRAIEDIRAALIRVRNASPEEAEVIPYVDAVGRSH